MIQKNPYYGFDGRELAELKLVKAGAVQSVKAL